MYVYHKYHRKNSVVKTVLFYTLIVYETRKNDDTLEYMYTFVLLIMETYL